MVSCSASSALLEKYSGKSARRCARCGSVHFSVNLMGGLVCSVCSPGESQLRLVAVEDSRGRLLWAIADSLTLAATDGGAGGRGAGLAGGAVDPFGNLVVETASPDEWAIAAPKTFSDGAAKRIDPPQESRLASMLVSTSLDWCTCTPGGFWDRDVVVERESGEFEQIGSRKKFRRPPSSGSWRPLCQAYFAWLVSRVDEWNRKTGRDAGQSELAEVAVVAVEHRVFGDWAMSDSLWPRLPPHGYIGPVAFAPWDIDRGAIPWDDAYDQRIAVVK